MSFSDVLLNFRAKHNLTQQGLSEILGVHMNMICKYETEKARPTRVNQIKFENKMKEYEVEKNV